MSAKDDGGPAFPTLLGLEDKGFGYQSARLDEGMSLRDYFAAKAMQAWIMRFGQSEPVIAPETASRVAYTFADAMLGARKK